VENDQEMEPEEDDSQEGINESDSEEDKENEDNEEEDDRIEQVGFDKSLKTGDKIANKQIPERKESIFGSTEELPLSYFTVNPNLLEEPRKTLKKTAPTERSSTALRTLPPSNRSSSTRESDIEMKILDLINKSSAEKLQEKLNTVGVKRAARIVAMRDKNGPFSSLRDLSELDGFGEKWVINLVAKNQLINEKD